MGRDITVFTFDSTRDEELIEFIGRCKKERWLEYDAHDRERMELWENASRLIPKIQHDLSSLTFEEADMIYSLTYNIDYDVSKSLQLKDYGIKELIWASRAKYSLDLINAINTINDHLKDYLDKTLSKNSFEKHQFDYRVGYNNFSLCVQVLQMVSAHVCLYGSSHGLTDPDSIAVWLTHVQKWRDDPLTFGVYDQLRSFDLLDLLFYMDEEDADLTFDMTQQLLKDLDACDLPIYIIDSF